MLERFYKPSSGSIKIGGTDIQLLNASNWREQIGFISQEPILFDCSIQENIRYGKPDASCEEVQRAAQLAHAHSFITKFPHGYETRVGERGTSLSGGQKQRIAIARAILKNPSILILDEATSALDTESEKLVQQAIENVMKNRTVLIIAHRLATIERADCILVMKEGRVVEKGTHAELMRRRGVYWNLHNKSELVV